MAGGPEPADHILDASAAAKLFLDEPESAAFRSWYLQEVLAGATFAAPNLLSYEVAHLLARNLQPPSGSRAAEWFAKRHDEVLSGIVIDEGGARRVFAWTGTLTGYDAGYLAVAVATRASLVTYDNTLLKEARKHGVLTHTPR